MTEHGLTVMALYLGAAGLIRPRLAFGVLMLWSGLMLFGGHS
jgi:hypothetical protein